MRPRRRLLARGGGGQAHPQPGSLLGWLGTHIWLALVGPKLKWGQKLGKLSVINQVLATLSRLFQKSLCSFLDCY